MVEEKKLAQVAPRRDEYEGYRDAVVEERVEANYFAWGKNRT